MKVRRIILLISLAWSASFSDTDDSIPQDPHEGEEHSKNVSGGIQGIYLDYDRDDVIWNFILD